MSAQGSAPGCESREANRSRKEPTALTLGAQWLPFVALRRRAARTSSWDGLCDLDQGDKTHLPSGRLPFIKILPDLRARGVQICISVRTVKRRQLDQRFITDLLCPRI